MYVGLGATIEDFRRRRQKEAWVEDENQAGGRGAGVAPATIATVYETEGAQWGTAPAPAIPTTVDTDILGAPPPPPPPAFPEPPPEPPPPLLPPESPTTASNSPDREDTSPATASVPASSGPVETIRVQLRNAGNFNSPDANTSLRFTMPGLSGALCATGAAASQLPAGSTFNTNVLGEWELVGRWGVTGSGCTFVAQTAREIVAGFVDAGAIAPQETPYTPPPGPGQGGTWCPPGQIPKPDGSGCFEPCPMRSQRFNEDTGECEDIVCPPGSIVGAYGECVVLAADPDTGAPIGVPVAPEPEPLPPKIDLPPEFIPVPQEGAPPAPPEWEPAGPTIGEGPIIVECAPGFTHDAAGNCVVADTPLFAPEILTECAPGYTRDDRGNCVLQVTGRDSEDNDDARVFGDDEGFLDPQVIESTAIIPPELPADPAPGGGGIGPPATGGVWLVPTTPDYGTAPGEGYDRGPEPAPPALGPGPALSPGADAPGFGIVELAISAGLAWILSEAYGRAK